MYILQEIFLITLFEKNKKKNISLFFISWNEYVWKHFENKSKMLYNSKVLFNL